MEDSYDNQIYVILKQIDGSSGFERERYIEDICSQMKPDTSQERDKIDYSIWRCEFVQSKRDEFYLCVELEIFIESDSLLADTHLFGARKISEHASHDEVFFQVQEWPQYCSENHIYCRSLRPNILPARTLDIGSKDGSQEPLLHVNETGEEGQWIALSHCWGDEKTGSFCRTLANNLAQHCRGIPLNTLPPTFRDAIIVTRKLGYRYLWIDSLCIVQDDPSDWKEESGKMVEIYQNAALVLAAETARNAQGGFIEGTGASVQPEGHLETRAWTLQERALASRVLHYNRDRLLWSCES
ncbi:HET-domain-containing protein, partial [Corynespora cassiicola Philippines]